jgi:hypothetical protein
LTPIPVVIIWMGGVSRNAAELADAFVSSYAQEFGWGLMDQAGSLALRIPALGISVHERAARPQLTVGRVASRHTGRTFSDLNRWMLKLLLLRDTPEVLWRGPRTPIAGASHLATVAGVSYGAAQRFVTTFSGMGYLGTAPQGLVVVRRAELLHAWLAQQVTEQSPTFAVRSIFGRPSGVADLFASGPQDVSRAIGGFEACRRLGVLHAFVPRVEVHVDRLDDGLLDGWGLELCEPRDAHCYLIRTKYPQSVMRGANKIDGLPVVDVFQAALDVVGNPARGREQAEYILREVLGWEL